MKNLEETRSIPMGQQAPEKMTVKFERLCVVTSEPEKFVEELERLCQNHCDSAGDYFFNFGFSD